MTMKRSSMEICRTITLAVLDLWVLGGLQKLHLQRYYIFPIQGLHTYDFCTLQIGSCLCWYPCHWLDGSSFCATFVFESLRGHIIVALRSVQCQICFILLLVILMLMIRPKSDLQATLNRLKVQYLIKYWIFHPLLAPSRSRYMNVYWSPQLRLDESKICIWDHGRISKMKADRRIPWNTFHWRIEEEDKKLKIRAWISSISICFLVAPVPHRESRSLHTLHLALALEIKAEGIRAPLLRS